MGADDVVGLAYRPNRLLEPGGEGEEALRKCAGRLGRGWPERGDGCVDESGAVNLRRPTDLY